MKTCDRPGCGNRFQPKSNRQRFCSPVCRYAARVLIDATRYGPDHRNLRKAIRRQVDAGGATCSRCANPILTGEPWDLDHADDLGPDAYRGVSHRDCNRAAPSKKQKRDEPTFEDDPARGVFYGPPQGELSDGWTPMPWSRRWFSWRDREPPNYAPTSAGNARRSADRRPHHPQSPRGTRRAGQHAGGPSLL